MVLLAAKEKMSNIITKISLAFPDCFGKSINKQIITTTHTGAYYLECSHVKLLLHKLKCAADLEREYFSFRGAPPLQDPKVTFLHN